MIDWMVTVFGIDNIDLSLKFMIGKIFITKHILLKFITNAEKFYFDIYNIFEKYFGTYLSSSRFLTA